jgi:hypothetical protein
MKSIETIPLENGLTVEVRDLSRPIATDTTKVELLFSVVVPLTAATCDDPDHYERLREVWGEALPFEFRAVRSFVGNAAVQTAARELREAFFRDAFGYLSRPDFPSRFARAKYREIETHPYRYRKFQKEN